MKNKQVFDQLMDAAVDEFNEETLREQRRYRRRRLLKGLVEYSFLVLLSVGLGTGIFFHKEIASEAVALKDRLIPSYMNPEKVKGSAVAKTNHAIQASQQRTGELEAVYASSISKDDAAKTE